MLRYFDHVHGSPAYVYDLAAIRSSYTQLIDELPTGSRVLYSVKANPHPRIIAELGVLGAGAEVSSSGELDSALAAGILPNDILHTGPGKGTSEIQHAIDRGVELFSVDSPDQIAILEQCARAAETPVRLLLRINGGDVVTGHGLTMTGQASQFGADLRWIEDDPQAFQRASGYATIIGFHVYQGTNLSGASAVLQQIEVAVQLCRAAAKALNIKPEIIDLGGGFGAPYAKAGDLEDLGGLRTAVETLLDHEWPAWRTPELTVLFESGRYLVATCGTFFTKVADVKRSQDRRVVIMESGINHLGGMPGLRRVPPLDLNPVKRDEATDKTVALPTGDECWITGPLCTPLDTLNKHAMLPEVKRGDVLAVENVGAYGLSASLIGFLGHPAPEEVVVDGDRAITRSRLLLRREEIPLPQNRTTDQLSD